LLGKNLVRLVYLDEGGVDFKAPILCVAGVLIHGDNEWPEVDRRILTLIDKHIPAPDRAGFIFHATDLFHGSRYFDRRKPEWASQEKRIGIFNELAQIIEDLHLPVVAGNYRKEEFGKGLLPPIDTPQFRGNLIHSTAAMDCLIRTDKWLEEYAPEELATVVHEDGTPAKKLIKHTLRKLRNVEAMDAEGLDAETRAKFNLPLRRVIDTVHFAEKADARPLQLADLCAFILARGLKELPVPAYSVEVVWRHMRWFFKAFSPPERAGLKPPAQPKEQLS
jgi:hypothetical protein